MAGGLILGLVSFKNLLAVWKHSRPEALIFLLGGMIFVAGGIGLEIVSYIFLRSGETPLLYNVEVLVEEFFEMAGVSVMLLGTLLFLHRTASLRPSPNVASS